MKPSTSQSHKRLELAFSNWGMSWGGWIDNRHGEWWLAGQALLISAHLLPTWPTKPIFFGQWQLPVFGWAIFIAGIFLAIKAFWGLGPSLSPLPDPKPGASLITSGEYFRCRHPLYQSILICSVGVLFAKASLLHLLLLICLCILLIGKAKREELQLKEIHKNYTSYMASTPAIIPKLIFFDWRK